MQKTENGFMPLCAFHKLFVQVARLHTARQSSYRTNGVELQKHLHAT